MRSIVACSWNTRPCPTDSNRCSNQCLTAYVPDWTTTLNRWKIRWVFSFTLIAVATAHDNSGALCVCVLYLMLLTTATYPIDRMNELLGVQVRWIAVASCRVFYVCNLQRVTRYGIFTAMNHCWIGLLPMTVWETMKFSRARNGDVYEFFLKRLWKRFVFLQRFFSIW